MLPSQNLTKHLNPFYRQNAELLNSKLGAYRKNQDLKV
jgi:hypothetical protein